MSASLPVLCYHSIAPGERISPELFLRHLEALRETGLPSLGSGQLACAPRGFVLTFDDGFADVWTHVLPALQTFGFQALVFAIPSRAGEGEVREQGVSAFPAGAQTAHAEASGQGGAHPGFLRWSELRALEASGAVRVESHSYGHKAGWVGDEPVGFHLGGGGKAHWSLAQATGGDTRLGIPLYRHGSALAHRLYVDDPGLRDRLAGWLEGQGGAQYVAQARPGEVEGRLREELRRYCGAGRTGGRWESDEERRKRTEEELDRARCVLESRLGGRRDELCLPWGHYDEVTLQCARRVGLVRVYTLDRGPNPAGKPGFLIRRFEPRRRDKGWLKTRLWLHRSTVRAALYAALSRRS